MSRIITFKGKLPMGLQEKLHLSTNNGLTGYKIKKFQIISNAPGTQNWEYVAKIYLTDQTGSIGPTVDFSDTDLLAVVYDKGASPTSSPAVGSIIIFDQETFNQDIFVCIADATGGTVECNYYVELEQFTLNLNESTYHTVKNIRSSTQA
jgi:hypothetical protein|tara:strand:- start:50 stop:499 length:450 start_codon:yes stop_codon:yes gene_type:complete